MPARDSRSHCAVMYWIGLSLFTRPPIKMIRGAAVHRCVCVYGVPSPNNTSHHIKEEINIVTRANNERKVGSRKSNNRNESSYVIVCVCVYGGRSVRAKTIQSHLWSRINQGEYWIESCAPPRFHRSRFFAACVRVVFLIGNFTHHCHNQAIGIMFATYAYVAFMRFT